MVGTPRYMAPEQWRSEKVTPATDLFACGALLFEMLTGAPAFRGETPMAIYDAVTGDQPPALVGDAGIEGLDRILQRALAKRPEDRFRSAAEMADALARGRGATRAASPRRREHTVQRLVVVPFRLLRPDRRDRVPGAGARRGDLRPDSSGLENLAVRSPRLVSGVTGDDPAGAGAQGAGRRRAARLACCAPARACAPPPSWSKCPAARCAGRAASRRRPTTSSRSSTSWRIRSPTRCAASWATATPTSAAGDVPADRAVYELYLRALELGRFTAVTSALVASRATCCSSVSSATRPSLPAWAQLGRVHRVLGKYAHADRAESVRRRGRRSSARFALAPDLPLDAQPLHQLRDREPGESGLGDAAPARPHRAQKADAELYAGLVIACRYCGLLEASLAAHDRARRLDPAIPRACITPTGCSATTSAPTMPTTKSMGFIRAYTLSMLGRSEEAIAIYRSGRSSSSTVSSRTWRSRRSASDRRSRQMALDAARRTIAHGGFEDPEGIYFIVRHFARLDELDEALDQLEQVVRAGFTVPTAFRADPWLAPLAGSPRFAAILEEADAAHRHAAEMFERAGGPRILGVLDPTIELPGPGRRP
jgi:tetratricopeptide (TPR) repeat protein